MNRFIVVSLLFLFVAVLIGCDPEVNNPVGPDPMDDDFVLVLNDNFQGEPVVIFYHNSFNVFAAYSRRLADGTTLEFKNNKTPGLAELVDTEGNSWNYLGAAISGNRLGTSLKNIGAVKGLWLAVSSCYPKATLYNKTEEERIDYENPTADWLINPSLIQQATAQDEIPALSYPKFNELNIKNPTQAGLAGEDDMIIVEHNNSVKIYPVKIMNWHEVLNDTIAGLPITVSHCPLTATTTVFTYDGASRLFGVSGKVHNNNLILYDKQTNSLWSQIKNFAINGPLIGQELVSVPFLEAKFKYVEQSLLSPNMFVMNFNTGFNMEYNIFPYGSYRTNNLINYPLSYTDDRIPPKELVLAIVLDNEAKVYRTTDFN